MKLSRNHFHPKTWKLPSRVQFPMLVLAIGLCGTFALWRQLDAMATSRARELATEDWDASTERAARVLSHQFDRIYDSLRMMATLPGVQKIDRHAHNFDADAHATAEAVYDNLVSDIQLSETYIVPADLDPDQIDPETGKPQIPITTFDSEIVGRSAGSKDDNPSHLEEVEIFEYRAMKQQIRYFKENFPTVQTMRDGRASAVTSDELITCDNTEFSSGDLAAHDNAPRLGLVYSVPVYGIDGRFRGMVSGIIRSRVVSRWLDVPYLTLSKGAGYHVTFGHDARRSDGEFGYYKNVNIAVADASPWTLTCAVPASVFLSGNDFAATCTQSWQIWISGVSLTLVVAALVWSMGTSRARAIGLARELTASFETTKQAAEIAEAHLRLLLDSTGEAIYGIDTCGICTFVNQAAAVILDYRPEELIGQNMHLRIHAKRADGSEHPVEQSPIYQSYVSGQGCRVVDDVFWRKDGIALPVEFSAFPICDGPRILGSVVTFSDVTLRHKAQAELRVAKELAESGSRAKSEFLARMSHEIRTPLNGVVGMIDLLGETELNANQRRYAELAKDASNSLMNVINDILDFSKIEAGKVELESILFDFHKLVEDLIELLGPIAARKNLALACLLRPDVPHQLRGDPNRIRQVLTNLLGNALKFTTAGSVGVRVSQRSRQENECMLHVQVEDTGMGIPENRLERLFHSFSQVDNSTTRRYGGTGLGLAISKRLVELMGGEIGVESRRASGTTFWFTLKLGVAEPVEAYDPVAALSGVRVLVIEPKEVCRHIREEQLEGWLRTFSVVGHSAEALDALREGVIRGEPLAVALLAYKGDESRRILEAIRSDSSLRATKLVAILETDDRTSPEEIRRLGFATSLHRPLTQSRLMDVIATTTAQPCLPSSPGLAAVSGHQPMKGLHLLVAEDNEMNQFVAERILERAGCTCEIVSDGRAAVESSARGGFDAILMDCQMPNMDGMEATRSIRRREAATPGSPRLPIIALTADAIQGDRENCLAAGMDGYVTKPINVGDLLKCIGELVRPGVGEPVTNTAANH